jgi:hypothetical protein
MDHFRRNKANHKKRAKEQADQLKRLSEHERELDASAAAAARPRPTAKGSA